MNINNIESFMYVVQFKSINKAASALFLSQPTVTARIKTLEKDLNTVLFKRDGRGLTLTDKGREFIPYAEQILRVVQQGKKQLKASSATEELVIGANIISSQYLIPEILPLLQQRYRSLRFRFISNGNDQLIDQLLRKEVDIAFIKETSHHTLIQYPAIDNSIKLIIRPDHFLKEKPVINAEDLARESFVFFECGAFDWDRIHKMFELAEIEPQIDLHVGHLEVAKAFILSGAGIGFLPRLSVKKELENGELHELNVDHLLQLSQSIHITHRNDESPSYFEDLKELSRQFDLRRNGIIEKIYKP